MIVKLRPMRIILKKCMIDITQLLEPQDVTLLHLHSREIRLANLGGDVEDG